jgi:septation ring formation regulator EzrA
MNDTSLLLQRWAKARETLKDYIEKLERENAALRERLQMIADAYALDANELRDIARTVTSKQTGDDAIMRQHLNQGGTPT